MEDTLKNLTDVMEGVDVDDMIEAAADLATNSLVSAGTTHNKDAYKYLAVGAAGVAVGAGTYAALEWGVPKIKDKIESGKEKKKRKKKGDVIEVEAEDVTEVEVEADEPEKPKKNKKK